MLRIVLRGIRTTLRRASPPATGGAQIGAVSFLHRFGSALNPHFRFHVVVLDGVFSEGDDGSVTFHEATHRTADDVHRLERTLQHRVLRLFQRRGLLTEDTVEDMLTWQASGGFSLDASVRVHGSDAARAPAETGYPPQAGGARPPFATTYRAPLTRTAPRPARAVSAKSSTSRPDPPATAAPSSPSPPLSFLPHSAA